MIYKSDMQEALLRNVRFFIKWTIISLVMGILCGIVGTGFGLGVAHSQRFFREHSFMLYLMPVSGILIVIVHKFFHQIGNKGTNMILESISSTEKIRFTTLPCIFISTLLSHIVGASAGKEGAALQIGGCIGNSIGEVFHLDERDLKVAIMSGMSGCFAAIFGTPLAAAMFGMEVISIGVNYYAALVPCVFSAFIGSYVSGKLGLHGEAFVIRHLPEFGAGSAIYMILLGLFGALVSIFFCTVLHKSHHLYKEKISNIYVRIITAAFLFIGLALIFGRDYCGAGFNLVEEAIEGNVPYEAFLLKILFTAVALGGGFKGGEIVPTLAIGATMGSAFGTFLGFEPSLCAACGMLALFVGVTNCPIATIFMGFEIFGFDAMPFFALTVAVSFAFSGYYGLYSSQKFTYSKTKTEFINIRAH